MTSNGYLHHQKNKTMKGKYITTSLLMAILGSGRSVEVVETIADTQSHELIWAKGLPLVKAQLAKLKDRDELKNA
jgi:hypothetical protein